jgi:hypothetical protein
MEILEHFAIFRIIGFQYQQSMKTRRSIFWFIATGAVLASLVWAGIDLWRRWQVTSLIIGLLFSVLGGCRA